MKNGSKTDLEIWTQSGDCRTSLLNSLCNNGGYTKQIHEHIRNKLVPVYMVSFMRWKDIK